MTRHDQALTFLDLGKADLAAAEELLHSQRVPDWIVGFHCQQAVEKFLKSVLSHHQIAFPKTHDLRDLMRLLADAGHALPGSLASIDVLTPFAVRSRYDPIPGAQAPSFDRAASVQLVHDVQGWAEQQLQP